MYHSYSVNDMPRPIPSKPYDPPAQPPKKDNPLPESVNNPKPPKGIRDEDIILLIVIFLLLAGECEDTLLLFALIYVFLTGYKK